MPSNLTTILQERPWNSGNKRSHCRRFSASDRVQHGPPRRAAPTAKFRDVCRGGPVWPPVSSGFLLCQKTARTEHRTKPPPQGEVPSAARRKGAKGSTERFCLPFLPSLVPSFGNGQMNCGEDPFSLASLDSSPRGGGSLFIASASPGFFGFRLCQTRAVGDAGPYKAQPKTPTQFRDAKGSPV